jgi:hypothetical protein
LDVFVSEKAFYVPGVSYVMLGHGSFPVLVSCEAYLKESWIGYFRSIAH